MSRGLTLDGLRNQEPHSFHPQVSVDRIPGTNEERKVENIKIQFRKSINLRHTFAELSTPPIKLFGRPDTVAASVHTRMVVTMIIVVAVPRVWVEDSVDDAEEHFPEIASKVPRHCCRRDRFISWVKLMVEWFMLVCKLVLGLLIVGPQWKRWR